MNVLSSNNNILELLSFWDVSAFMCCVLSLSVWWYVYGSGNYLKDLSKED